MPPAVLYILTQRSPLRFNHPRFGAIKCIRTIQHVKPGDELIVAYGYDHSKLDTDAPDWYRHKVKEWNNHSSARRLENYHGSN